MYHRPFLMEVDLAKTNQCMEPFYPSFDPLIIWCGNNPLILSRNDKDLEDSPTSFTSSSLLVVFSSFTPVSFSCTSKCHLTFFVFYFCSSYILHLRACVDCKNVVRSWSSLHWFLARMSQSSDGIKKTSGSPKLLIFFSHPRPINIFFLLFYCVHASIHDSNL